MNDILARGVDEKAEQIYLNGMSWVCRDVADLVPGVPGVVRQSRCDQHWALLSQLPTVKPALVVPDDGTGWSTQTAEDMLGLSEPVLLAIDQAQKSNGIVFAREVHWNQPMPLVQAVRVISLILNAELRLAAEQGDFAEVHAAVRRLFRLTRDLRLIGGDLVQYVAISVENDMIEAMRLFLLTRDSWGAEDYRKLLALIDEQNKSVENQVDHIFKQSYIYCGNDLWGFERGTVTVSDLELENAPEQLIKSINYAEEWKALNKFYSWLFDDYLSRPYSQNVGSTEASERVYDLRKPILALNIHGVKDLEAAGVLVDGKLPVIGLTPLLLPRIADIQEVCVRNEFWRKGLGLQIRIQLHQRLHGAFPATLDELTVSTGMQQIPKDPYADNGPLKYRLTDDAILIYSVGKDQIDQSGEIDWDFGERPGDFIFSVWRR